MDNNRNWNHPHPDPRLHMENGTFVLPVDISLRSNDHRLLSSELLHYREANAGVSHNPYPHPSSAGSSSRVPQNYVQHQLPSYNQFRIGGASGTAHPQMDYGRASVKRKTPDFSMAFDSGSSSSNGYYSAGSSSGLHVSSGHLQPKPIPGPQCWPRDLSSMGPGYASNNLLISREGSHRNVRSRHLETNPSWTRPSNNLPHQNSTVNTYGALMAGQGRYTPVYLDSRMTPPEIRRIGQEMNRPLAGSSIPNMEVDRGYHSNQMSSRNLSTPLPTIYDSSTRGAELGHSSYGQRTNPYQAIIPNHWPRGFAATSEDGRWPVVTAVAPPRHSRPLSIVGRSSERVGRPRNIQDRFRSFSDGDNARNRWISEGVIVIDQSTFYDSRAFFNHHHDMGVDVDSMSYEELLALEERIGNVSTGLSEGMISKCLMEMIHNSDQIQDDDDDDEEEQNCAICLEEYKDEERLGRLKCRHEFHFSCIKKWLLMKNACPICKASASEDTKEE